MYPPANVLRHTQSGRKGVDGASRVGQDREFSNFESLADGVYIICFG